MGKRSVLYEVLRPVVAIGLRLFHGKFRVVGFENLKGSETPTIVVGNHQNAMIDPILCCTVFNEQLHWLTRSDIFKPGIVNTLLRNFNMLPVYRDRDNVGDMRDRNEEIFQECYRRLNNGSWVCLFPEGTHQGRKRLLLPLKKGVGRLIIGTFEANSNLEKIRIVPVGLEYEETYNKDGNILVRIGEPVTLSKEDYNTANKAIWANQLVADITTHLHDVMTDIQDEENYDNLLVVQDCFHLAFPEYDWHENIIAFQEAHNAGILHDEVLLKNAQEVVALNEQLGIRVKDKVKSNLSLALSLFTLILFFPAILVGRVLFVPISMFTENFIKKNIKDQLFYNSIRISFKTFIGVFFVLLYSVIAKLIGFNFWPSLVIIVTVGMAGHWGRRLFNRLQLRFRLKQLEQDHPNEMARWNSHIHHITERLNSLLHESHK